MLQTKYIPSTWERLTKMSCGRGGESQALVRQWWSEVMMWVQNIHSAWAPSFSSRLILLTACSSLWGTVLMCSVLCLWCHLCISRTRRLQVWKPRRVHLKPASHFCSGLAATLDSSSIIHQKESCIVGNVDWRLWECILWKEISLDVLRWWTGIPLALFIRLSVITGPTLLPSQENEEDGYTHNKVGQCGIRQVIGKHLYLLCCRMEACSLRQRTDEHNGPSHSLFNVETLLCIRLDFFFGIKPTKVESGVNSVVRQQGYGRCVTSWRHVMCVTHNWGI